jgi:hypothetical protein
MMEENKSWLQAKVAAQKVANDRMHSTIVRQRFVLRTLERLGRVLTAEEWKEARDQENEQARDRIGDPV